MTTLTSRIIAILSDKPATALDIWDALADDTVRSSDVRAELRALCDEGVAEADYDSDALHVAYSLAAQAVAS